MSKLLVLGQNSKMKQSSTDEIELFHTGIPAYKSDKHKINGKPIITCKPALHCISGCYAAMKSSSYKRLPCVSNKYEERLGMILDGTWLINMSHDLNKLARRKKKRQLLIRINDSGDLSLSQYRRYFLELAQMYPNVRFYAYTKEIRWAKLIQKWGLVPQNITLIFSYGGKYDHLIDPKRDRHARVFENETDIPAGYINASHDDKLALTENLNIALVYHGSKNYAKTGWSNVS